MSRQLLVIVSANPADSHRAAEAVRIAAGIAAWKEAEVSLCLRDQAQTLLQDDPEPAAQQTLTHLAILAELHPILLLAPRAREFTPASPTLDHRLINLDELARLAAQSECVLHF